MRFGPNGKAGAELVSKLVEGATPTQDTRADATVDLVIGNGFKALGVAPTRRRRRGPRTPADGQVVEARAATAAMASSYP